MLYLININNRRLRLIISIKTLVPLIYIPSRTMLKTAQSTLNTEYIRESKHILEVLFCEPIKRKNHLLQKSVSICKSQR